MTADDTTPQTSGDEVIRDDEGRDIRIYGLVLDDANPARTLRELLRQWSITDEPSANLRERTAAALNIIGTDGRISDDQ